ncbi:MAG: hypothetical protein ACRERU_05745 [Methylococcales bacterium]
MLDEQRLDSRRRHGGKDLVEEIGSVEEVWEERPDERVRRNPCGVKRVQCLEAGACQGRAYL